MQFDLTNKTPTCKSFGMQFNADNRIGFETFDLEFFHYLERKHLKPIKRTVADPQEKSFALTDSNVEETKDKPDDEMIELTLPSPRIEKSRKKGAKVIEKRKSETYVKNRDKSVDETEINFNPKPKPKKIKKKKDKTVSFFVQYFLEFKSTQVIYQAENFTVANPNQLVEEAADEYEDYAFDLLALFEAEAVMLPPKWTKKPNCIAAANHIQNCLEHEFQSKADQLLAQRKSKGKQVNY